MRVVQIYHQILKSLGRNINKFNIVIFNKKIDDETLS